MLCQRPNSVKYLLIYLAFAIALALFLGSFNWMTYYRLSKRGIGINAIVTKTSCSYHMTFSYQFKMKGQRIDGVGGDDYGNPTCYALKEGDPVLIYFLSSQPEINVPGDPKERLNNETISIMMAALIFPALLVFSIKKWMEKQKQA